MKCLPLIIFITVAVCGCASNGRSVASNAHQPAKSSRDLLNSSRSLLRNDEDIPPPQPHVEKAEGAEQPVRTIAYHPQPDTESPVRSESLDSKERAELAMAESSLLENGGLNLATIEALALANNPSIQQAESAVCQAIGNQQQVGLKPNPSMGYFAEEVGNADSAGLHGAFISQTIVRGDKLQWNRHVVGHDIRTMRWLAESQRARIRTDIRIQFYETLAVQKRLKLASDFRSVAEKAVEVSQVRVNAGEGTRADVLQSQVQLSEIDLTIRRINAELDAAWQEMAAIAGIPALTSTILIGDLKQDAAWDSEMAWSRIVAESPQLAAARTAVARARANWHRQSAQPISNVNAQLGVGHDDGTGDEFANVQVSIPVPLHNRNQGNIQAAYAQLRSANQNAERLECLIRQNLAQAMKEYQMARASVDQYENQILPMLDETLDLLERGRVSGEFNVFRVLTAQRTYFESNLAYISAQADLAKATALIDGMVLRNGLSTSVTYPNNDELRSQAFNGQ